MAILRMMGPATRAERTGANTATRVPATVAPASAAVPNAWMVLIRVPAAAIASRAAAMPVTTLVIPVPTIPAAAALSWPEADAFGIVRWPERGGIIVHLVFLYFRLTTCGRNS